MVYAFCRVFFLSQPSKKLKDLKGRRGLVVAFSPNIKKFHTLVCFPFTFSVSSIHELNGILSSAYSFLSPIFLEVPLFETVVKVYKLMTNVCQWLNMTVANDQNGQRDLS